MVLVGKTNRDIVAEACRHGAKAVGISGKDASLLVARKVRVGKNGKNAPDLGFAGEVETVNPEILETLVAAGYLPVVAPAGMGPGGETYNINADNVAANIAIALKAKKLILLTDSPGVLADRKDAGSLIS
jgi:acetylglutamate kinase